MNQIYLTKREKQILGLIVKGHSNTQISQDLSISESTVKKHCKAIFEKLNVEGRVTAAVKALSEGLIYV